MYSITILGSTGSIGESTLDVIAQHSDQYSIFALTGCRQLEKLAQQSIQYNAKYAVVTDESSAKRLTSLIMDLKGTTEVMFGSDALSEVASSNQVDIVMAAIVGAAGLLPTLSAVKAGKKVLLANKESLVMAGSIFMGAVKQHSATLLPIDSEHNAIFQCLPDNYNDGDQPSVKKLILSASGGPFRTWDMQKISKATPEQACAHPNWSMGNKISVDSASMMNKGLECIEAKWLFDTTMDKIEVLIHPQSIVHSLVQYVDGSVLAQLGNPDMRTPIAHGLAWPQRLASGVADLDLSEIAQLTFEQPDLVKFPCLQLAYNAAAEGGNAPAVLNAANEIAVDAFLDGRIGFTAIAQAVEKTLDSFDFYEPESLDAVQDSDNRARSVAVSVIKRIES
ncbi:MAG: 1-deoxy-D-xylulose-5-phosphate reductoisomerase [Porticoccaceae bacterium]|nr:1-deoxy-D-xylulose-5-phosphate reductoisomerase [Porticoccaceae bacterium]